MKTDHKGETCEARVLARLDAEGIAGLTASLVRAPSENPGGCEEAAVACLADSLRRIGADVTLDCVAPGRPNLIAHLGDPGASGGVLFLGHSDVVPAGDGWTGNPFEPRREGGYLIGRGATDMKGGLAAVVGAMAAVHAEMPSLPMTLVCTVDEEAGAAGVLRYIASTRAGSARARQYAACVVAEPTGLVTITGCRGAANFRVDIHGASAHAGNPDEGASAILAAADLIAVIENDHADLQRSPHPVLGAGTWNPGTITGGHGISIVPNRCTLRIDRRTLPDEDPAEVLDSLLEAARRRTAERGRPGADRIAYQGTVEANMPGFSTEPDSTLVGIARQAVRDTGGEGRAGIWTAACEGGFIARHHQVPTVVLGPGDLAHQAHQPDERVRVAELHQAARAFALITLRAAEHPQQHPPAWPRAGARRLSEPQRLPA